MPRMLLPICLGVIAFNPAEGRAQDVTVRTNVPLVSIPVTVTDRHGRFILGLTASDFVVLDNGRPIPIQVDDPDTFVASLNVLVVVQTSDISQSALLKVQKVGTMLEDAVAGANGSVALATFDNHVNLLQDFTNDDNLVASAFRNLKSSDSRDGKMLDAVAKAVDLFGRHNEQAARRVLVIIGESKDRGSKAKLADLLLRLQANNIAVYSLAYSAYLTPLTTKASEYSPPEGGRGWILDSITEAVHASKPDTGKLLVKATGGRQLKFETSGKLQNDLIKLGSELHSRYGVSFTPPADNQPGFHAVEISIRNRPELLVTARPGYFPAETTSAH